MQQVVIFELGSADGTGLPSWSAGAHIDVQVQDSLGRTVQRQYSLCGKVAETTWKIAVLDGEDGRGGARWLHSTAKVGSRLTLSTPRNNFRLHAGAAPAVLVAGGIGITPILPMARELTARGNHFSLHYYTRSTARTAFLDEITGGELSHQSTVSFDDEPTRTRQPISEIFSDVRPGTHLYICGPAAFMNAVTDCALDKGVDPSHIHRELFASATDLTPHGKDKAFDIQLLSSGQVIAVQEGTTAVQALAAAGIEVVVSCEQGLCGSCLTRVVEGTPDHRDQFLMPEEQALNDCFTPCCSRALSARLVLDL